MGVFVPRIFIITVFGILFYSIFATMPSAFAGEQDVDVGTSEWIPIGEDFQVDRITGTTGGICTAIPADRPSGGGISVSCQAKGTCTINYKYYSNTSDRLLTGTLTTECNGCLIATATYGTDLAPEVQLLREIRDNQLMKTQAGSSFMQFFNQHYYTFSPTVAGWEHQNPIFKEVVKLTITPLITSLSILNYVEMDSEAEVLGYGISLILLNVGMYFVAPVVIVVLVRRKI